MSDARSEFFASGSDADVPAADRSDFFSGKLDPDTLTDAAPSKPARTDPRAVVGNVIRKEVTGMGASIAGGAREIYDLIRGKSMSEANQRYQQFVTDNTFQPQDEQSQGAAATTEKVMGSDFNPLNWPKVIADEAVRRPLRDPEDDPAVQEAHRLWVETGGKQGLQPTTGSTISPAVAPIASGALQFAAQAAPAAGALRAPREPVPGAAVTPDEVPPPAVSELELAPTTARTMPERPASAPTAPLSASEAPPRAAAFEPQDIPGKPGVHIDTEPVEGGLPEAATSPRAQILRRVGLENARESAIKGDAKNAATDFQMSRFDEPAGVQAKAQFESERNTLQNHAEGIVNRTGGTLGMDEDSLHVRGQTIAKPFDDLNQWFDNQTSRLYAAADERAKGAPVTNLESVDALLKSSKFRNSLLAKDQGSLLNAVEGQLEEFRKGNPGGFTVAGAEEMRQWLNQVWSHENRWAVGQVKDALDNDVLKGAGEDIYGPARAIVQQRKATLENPKGISRLMDADPQSPLNRVTPHVKVPDTVMRLDPAQFENVVQTLKDMPAELQPQAQAALAEMKAHFANKLLEEGGKHQTQWNAPGVSKVLKGNSAKIKLLFADDPQGLQAISDLDSAGKILRVDASYPGAAAQAANAMKRGFLSRAIPKLAATGGAAAGGIFGPLGAAAGAAAGEGFGSKMGASMAERAAVKQWNSKISPLAELNEK